MPAGIIPPSLKIDHAGRLSQVEDRLVDSFLAYAGKVHAEIAQGDLYLEGQGHALARLMCLLDDSVSDKALELYLGAKHKLSLPNA